MITLRKKGLILLMAAFLSLAVAGPSAPGEPASDLSPVSESILNKYLQAAALNNSARPGTSVEVEIDASIPKLKENGRLHARRIISKVGQISYRVMGFQGSNTVKNQVIARYLQAEQQGQSNPKLALTPANYKFKLKGERITDAGRRTYVFAVAPHHAAPGLFKGELWLDEATYLPIYEKGRLSKNPSIFFKKVDFERAFAMDHGRPVPRRTSSIISTSLVGKVELNVNYSNYEEAIADESQHGSGNNLEAVSAP